VLRRCQCSSTLCRTQQNLIRGHYRSIDQSPWCRGSSHLHSTYLANLLQTTWHTLLCYSLCLGWQWIDSVMVGPNSRARAKQRDWNSMITTCLMVMVYHSKGPPIPTSHSCFRSRSSSRSFSG
jgi:hypothetical protein